MAFDERQFRDALGQFATGVAVVTSQVDGVKVAITVSSFNAVSLRPPLVLFSIARSVQSFALWQRVERFAVMILQEGQGALSSKFARPGENKFHDIEVVPGVTGVPLLPRAGSRASNARSMRAMTAVTTRSWWARSSICTTAHIARRGRSSSMAAATAP